MTRVIEGGEYLLPEEFDAVCIEEWLVARESHPALPGSAGDYVFAHENPDAWPLVRLPSGVSLSQAKAMMALLEPVYRFNPYHGKDGKFASSNAMGSWAPMSMGAAREEQAALNMSEYGPGISANQAQLLADRQIPAGMRVFASKNGGRTYVHKDADVDDEHLGMMFRDMDNLSERFPVDGKMVINVQPRYKFTDNALGETVISKPVFRFSDDMVMGRNIKRDPDHTFHPEGFYTNPRKNLIAHEYGHAVDKRVSVRNQQETAFWKSQKDGLSRYGRGYNASEGFAEAFSDYITTPKGAWMKGTQSYVDRYGWEGK